MNAIRRIAGKFLEDTASIESLIENAIDESGQSVVTYAAATSSACSVESADRIPTGKLTANQLSIVTTWTISFPAGVVLKRGDRVTVTFALFDAATTAVFIVDSLKSPETYSATFDYTCKMAKQ